MKEVLSDFKSQNKLQKGFTRVNIEHAWKEVMGSGVTNYTTQIKFTGATLYVELSSSILREELLYGKSQIITNLNKHLGNDLIQKIVLR